MLISLKGQLDQLDFIGEHERALEEIEAYEEYYLEQDQDEEDRAAGHANQHNLHPNAADDIQASPDFNNKYNNSTSKNRGGGLFFQRGINKHQRYGSENYGSVQNYTNQNNNLISIKEELDTNYAPSRITRATTDQAEQDELNEAEVSSEDSEDFLKNLGFKDPFHKNLMSESFQQEGAVNSAADINSKRMEYPHRQFMTQEKLQQVNGLL